MKSNYLLIVVFLIGIIIVSSISYSIEDKNLLLYSGKNLVYLNNTEPFYVGDMIKLNPDIEYVSYQTSDNSTKGFINVFGGIGENFIVFSDVEYEVFVARNISLVLPLGV